MNGAIIVPRLQFKNLEEHGLPACTGDTCTPLPLHLAIFPGWRIGFVIHLKCTQNGTSSCYTSKYYQLILRLRMLPAHFTHQNGTSSYFAPQNGASSFYATKCYKLILRLKWYSVPAHFTPQNDSILFNASNQRILRLKMAPVHFTPLNDTRAF